ncbi:hypothetical protein [Effusibacillus pohliae]|uniref:hypothetical protein n=1 Tax=Effusibacillus pohliae TaxID=232270 RepID=UPI000372D6CD|nr:hypothetical protein [Effusibacillus pohliae]
MVANALREKIFAAKDIKSEIVEVEEWGVKLEVRGMTGRARSELISSCMDNKGNFDLVKLYPQIVIATVYDPETGEKVFDPADRDALNEKSSGALEKVAQVAMRLSGLDMEAMNQARKN